MKVNYGTIINKVSKCSNQEKNVVAEKVKNIADITEDCTSDLCEYVFGQAQVNMQKKSTTDIINSIIDNTHKIKRNFVTKNGVERFIIGKPIEGWKDLLETVSNATCHFDGYKNLKRIFLQNENTLETKIYNSLGIIEKTYTPEDMKTLKYYKYNPDSIHSILRYGKQLYKGNWAEETETCIKKLDKIFENNAFCSEKPIKLYRGMHTTIDKIGNIGDIYKDSSFVSTSTNLDVAKRFAHDNPIMEITFPKYSKYIDMDSLFNIDREHWKEEEYLLNRNSKFLITDYDKSTNIIKAEFLP